MRYQITKEDRAIVDDFIEKISTDHYAKRGQHNPVKRKLDQRVGKLAELASFNLLQDRFPGLQFPDFKIYSVGRKSWAGDLPYNDGTVHSKSQLNSQAERYGSSWVFEKIDREIFDKYGQKDYVSFSTVNLIENYVDIDAIVKVSDLHTNNLFSMLKIDYLNRSKTAVYRDGLVKAGLV